MNNITVIILFFFHWLGYAVFNCIISLNLSRSVKKITMMVYQNKLAMAPPNQGTYQMVIDLDGI